MYFKTRKQLHDSVMNELALVTGASVQTYNEPIMYEYIQRGFDHLFEKRFWHHLTSTTFHNLDGVVGVITDELTNVHSAEDVKWIRQYPYEPHNELLFFADGLFNTAQIGYSALPYGHAQYDTKRFQFYPVESELQLAIRARRKPDDFIMDDDVVPFDGLAIIHFVAASILAIDGMNPTAMQRHNALFDDRYSVLIANEGDKKFTSTRGRFDGEFTVAP